MFHNVIEVEELKSYDESEESTEFSDEAKRKFRLLGPFGKLHNIIVNIRGSPSQTAEFLQLAGQMIPLDNRTRWNSWYLSLVIAKEHASSIDTYTKAVLIGISFLRTILHQKIGTDFAKLKVSSNHSIEILSKLKVILRPWKRYFLLWTFLYDILKIHL